MFKKITLSLVLSICLAAVSLAQNASIKGKILDETGEGMPFVNVALYQNGSLKSGATTDMEGEFRINGLDAGKYDLEVKFVGYQSVRMDGIILNSSRLRQMDPIQMKVDDGLLEEFEVISFKVPLIDKDGGASGGTVTREDLARMPGRSATSIATTVGGVGSDADGNIKSIRGSREGDTYYYIDGIKVRGSSSLPKSAIEEVAVITGGLPANYGDATGGIIAITTRGASSFFFGGIEAVSSGFKTGDNKTVGLDNYGYNLVEGILSGPLLMRKDSTGAKADPILGFFLSGNFTNIVDSRPLAVNQYRLKPSVRDALIDPEQMGPLRPSGTGVGVFYNTDFLTPNDFEEVKFRQNKQNTTASLAAKIDVNAGANMNISFGASGNYYSGQGGRNSGNFGDWSSSLMNYNNLPEVTTADWRAYGKFTQRFSASAEDQKEGSKGVSNAFYTIMVDYSKSYDRVQDATHKDKLFNYGHVGTFTVDRELSYEPQDVNGDGTIDGLVHTGWNDLEVHFTPSELNKDLAALTNQYFTIFEDDPIDNYENFTQIQNGNALLNGMQPDPVYDMWQNIGTRFNNFSKSEETQFRLTAQGSADIGNHAISLGFEYEQRVDRGYSMGPIGMWTQMRQLANNHIKELDKQNPMIDNFGSYARYTYGRLNDSPGEYTGSDDGQAYFDYNLRNALGLNPDGTDFIDVDALDPNMFSLDMFSADELLNGGSGFIGYYYGYDHTGKKIKENPSFDDFFVGKDESNNFSRLIGAYEPIYISGYIMDKFAFDDLIFNVGLRVDRFDANQKVLKDPYSLYLTRTAGEVTEINNEPVTHPSNIPSSAIVYVDDVNDPSGINGYRDENTWYNAQGQIIADPKLIESSAGIAPFIAQGVDPNGTISSEAFEDYTPQITVMPRVAFSFPISDEALFFAHYDILSKRPTDGNRLDLMDYYYMRNRNVVVNNPNLKPEKTIDYELGFQQVLSKKSSLKISGFYREQRNQVTIVNVAGAYPVTYRSWGNRDFGTVKGLTIAYDLRRSGNITLRASYTLQFAEGTGSDAQASLGLINSGQPNLRTIFPYSYDQRHAITGTVDYRYGEGKDYNGPVIAGKNILQNTGVNFMGNYASGTPYSAQTNITGDALFSSRAGLLEGRVNGSRKPGQFRLDMQIDKNITLKFGEEKKKSANLNVYLLVNNLLDTRNILSVYRATGNPDDDGYLNAAEYQNAISLMNDEQTYRYYYGLKVNNPYNYAMPRTMRLGIKLDF